jgi:hypothetical protein
MNEQRTFADAILSNMRHTTRRAQLLTEIDLVIKWVVAAFPPSQVR